MRGTHEFFCCGARVRIHNGEIEVLEEPKVVSCPLCEIVYGFKSINKETVKKIVSIKMNKYGFCGENRVFDDSLVVPYGASEMIMCCMKRGLLDGAVIVCEGAGTVVTTNPSLVQEIGARLGGIIKTSPIKGIIRYIENEDGMVLDKNNSLINQCEGLRRAVKLGLKRIAVTIAGFNAKEIVSLREIERRENVSVTIFSVCNTSVTRRDLKYLMRADVICSSASALIRREIGPKALMQLGVSIPIFALTERGKEIILNHLLEFNDKIVAFRSKLPYIVKGRGPMLKI